MTDRAGLPPRRYAIPKSATRLSLLSAAGAGLVCLLGFVMYASGWTRAASPGPLSAGHAPIDATCAQCHQPRTGVTDLRCERCHDPLDSGRFSAAAHVVASSGDLARGDQASDISCATCHIDHRGRNAVLRTADERECSGCHQLRSFKNHPEFAPIRAGGTVDTGLTFSHAKHLEVLSKKDRGRCEVCHERREDERAFKPLDFDRHCADCHIKDRGLTNGVDALTATWPEEAPERPSTALAHRDTGLLAQAAQLTLAIDPAFAETGAARLRLIAAIAATRGTAPGALAGLGAAQLETWAAALEADLRAIDQQRASPADQVSPETSQAISALAAALTSIDPALQSVVEAIVQGPAAVMPDVTTQERNRQFEDRRSEITALLDAVAARTGATAPSSLASLKRRLTALVPDASNAGEAPASIDDRLRGLEGPIAMIEGSGGAALASELRQITARARAQLEPGTPGAELERRRAELTALFDVMESAADPLTRHRVSDLRAALASLGGTADELARRRDEKVRLLARIRLQRELLAEPQGPTEAATRQGLVAQEARLASLISQLARLDEAMPRESPAAISPRTAKRQLGSLLEGCRFCHNLNKDGSALAPVRADLSMLPASTFSHKPHVSQTKCESCHTTVATSGARLGAQDSLLPTVASCQTCHTAGGSRTNCASCHTFHLPHARAAAGVRP